MSCTEDPTKPHFNILYLVALLFAPPILHPTNHFLDREVFDLLVKYDYDYFCVHRLSGHWAMHTDFVCVYMDTLLCVCGSFSLCTGVLMHVYLIYLSEICYCGRAYFRSQYPAEKLLSGRLTVHLGYGE